MGAQAFPNRPISLVTASAGGGRDLVAQMIAQGITAAVGQPVRVKAMGGGSAAPEMVAKAAPDGHTLLVLGPSFWITPLLKKTAYDAVKDFVPIILAVTQPNILVAHPSVPANSVAELIALARAQPKKLRYATGLDGAPSHLAGALFTHQAGVDMVRVPYIDTANLAMNDLVAGKVHTMIFSSSSGLPHVKAGKVKALAVTSSNPSALAPGLPTIAATLPGYSTAQPIGIFAPASTPQSVIDHMHQVCAEFLNNATVKKQLLDAGMEVVASSPQELGKLMESEIAIFGQLIEDLGLRR